MAVSVSSASAVGLVAVVAALTLTVLLATCIASSMSLNLLLVVQVASCPSLASYAVIFWTFVTVAMFVGTLSCLAILYRSRRTQQSDTDEMTDGDFADNGATLTRRTLLVRTHVARSGPACRLRRLRLLLQPQCLCHSLRCRRASHNERRPSGMWPTTAAQSVFAMTESRGVARTGRT